MFTTLALLSIPWMTKLSRMAGGGKPKLPLGLDQWLLPLPYILFWTTISWWVIPAYLSSVLALRMGHGSGFHYKLPFEADRTPEKVEYLIPSSLPVYWQKFLIMALTGLAVTLLLGILMAIHHQFLAAIILVLSGGLKAIAYLAPKTEWSEYLRGLALGLGVALAYFLL